MVSLMQKKILAKVKQAKANYQASKASSASKSAGVSSGNNRTPPGGTRFNPLASAAQTGNKEAVKLAQIVKPKPMVRADPNRPIGNKFYSIQRSSINKIGSDVPVPAGANDTYDIVTTSKIGMGKKKLTIYRYDQSKALQRKIRIAGSGANYDEYLRQVRDRPWLGLSYSLNSGGEGYGPFSIIPSMGTDLLTASRTPGITGASEREEKLIAWRHRAKGSPTGGPTPGRVAMGVVQNPFAQALAGTVLVKVAGRVVPVVVRGAVRSQRVVPRVVRAFPQFKGVGGRLDAMTGRLSRVGGRVMAEGDEAALPFSKTAVGRNFLLWSREGRIPVTKTEVKVLRHLQYSPPQQRGIGVGLMTYDQEMISRNMRYVPKRQWGFAEREFVSPSTAARYNALIKRSPVYSLSKITRGQGGRSPWMETVTTADKELYKRSLLPWRGVQRRYVSMQTVLRDSKYPGFNDVSSQLERGSFPKEFTTLDENVMLKVSRKPIVRRSSRSFLRNEEGSTTVLRDIVRTGREGGLLEPRGYARAAGRETGSFLIPSRDFSSLPTIMTILAARAAGERSKRAASVMQIPEQVPGRIVTLSQAQATDYYPPPPPPPEAVYSPPPSTPAPPKSTEGRSGIAPPFPIIPRAQFGGRIDSSKHPGPGGYTILYDELAASQDLLRRLII